MDELKPCPLLVQSDTNPSSAQNWMRPYFLECFGDRYILCAAYRAGYGCPFVYDNRVDSKEDVSGMNEYIEREAAIRALTLHDCDSAGAKMAICDLPAADVATVWHGQWEWDTEDIYRCSNCAEKSHVKEVMGRPAWGYCPNCGAMMEGGSDG